MGDKKVVLAIDDNPQQLQNYKLHLQEKYDFRAVDSVTSSLGFLEKNKVDVILLDIEMPEIDGFEFLDNIRGLINNMDAPIIIVSGNTGEDFIGKTKNFDAFDVLTKPVKQETLIHTIERALASAK